ncbi:MAG: phage holin family protein [Dehalococcoidia bacterium]|nr:phage holin family protein [Dehalococcoidia bacterium]
MAITTDRSPTDGSSPDAVRDDVNRGREEVRSLGARTAEITEDLRELARREMALAQAEMADNRQRLMTGSTAGVAAGVFAFWLLGFLGLAMMFGLMEVWPEWAAALATAGAWLLLAAVAAFVARSRFKDFSPTPKRTMASLKEDAAWLRRLTRRNAGSANSGP